jgi:hypothetical protein
MVSAVLLLASGTAPGGHPTAGAQGEHAVFGALAQPREGESQRQAIEGLENAIGRPFEGVRVFKRWDFAFPTDYDRWLRNSGHTLYLSVAPQRNNGDMIPWRSIADAPFGSPLHEDMIEWAERVRDFGATVYFAFDHEPEGGNPSVMGTKADFIDAYRRIVTVFRNNGVTNARFTWIITGYTFGRTDANGPWSWYPGDDYVDVIGADDYNWFGCRPGVPTAWRSFAQIFEPVRAFGAAHPDKTIVIAEWGSVEDGNEPGRKAAWIQEAQSTLASPGWEQFGAVLYYHAQGQVGNPPCQFWVDSSTSSLNAFAAMGADPHFAEAAPPQITTLSPTAGMVGAPIVVTGRNFSGVQHVTFDGVSADFSVASLSSLTATVPEGATAGPVVVTTGLGSVTGPVFIVVHQRTVSLSLGGATASGAVSVRDDFLECAREQRVKIQRRTRGRGWRTVALALTNGNGAFTVGVGTGEGRYRASLGRVVLDTSDVCTRSRSRMRRSI